MSKRDFKILLEDIEDAINNIEKYTAGMDYKDFVKDRKTIDAVVRNLEIIGEASNRIPNPIKNRYNKIEWNKVVSVRNRIIHEYFGVDYEIIWEIVTKNLGDLKDKIAQIIKENPSDNTSLFE
jgi:uncharacterized protein with HEPN domain